MLKQMMTILLGLSLLLVACGGSEPEPEPTAVPPTEEPTAVPTEAPTATPDVTASFVELDSQVGGYNLRHPQDWQTVDFFGMTLLGTDDGVLESPEQITSGAVNVVMAGPREELESESLLESMEAAAEEMNPNPEAGEATILEEPTALTINGLDAAQMVLEYQNEDGSPLTFVLTLVADETQAATLIGLTPSSEAEQYIPVFKAIAETITVFEPTAEPDFGLEEVDPEMETDIETDNDAPVIEGETAPGRSDVRLVGSFVSDGSSFSDVQTVTTAEKIGWTFAGTEGELIDVEVATTEDVVIDVVDSTGGSILPFGEVDRVARGGESIYFLQLPATETYTVVAYEFSGVSMTAELLIAPAGTGTLLQVIDRGEMTVGESRDYEFAEQNNNSLGYLIPFMADAGSVVDIVVAAQDENVDLTISVWDAFGEQLTNGYIDGSGSGGTEEVTDYPVTSDGIYFVSVREYFGNLGSFNVAITPSGESGDSETAVPTSSTSGGAYVIGNVAGGNLAENGTDLWLFDGGQGEVIDIIVSPAGDLDVVVDVIQVSTNESITLGEVDNAFGEETIDKLRLPADDSYQIIVRGFSGQAGEYVLSSFAVDMSAIGGSNSGEVAFGTAINGTIVEDEGYWTFSASAGDMVTVAVQPLGEFDIVLDVHDSKGTSLTEGEVDDGFSGTAEVATVTISETGDYTIILRGFAGNGGDYVLTVVSQ